MLNPAGFPTPKNRQVEPSPGLGKSAVLVLSGEGLRATVGAPDGAELPASVGTGDRLGSVSGEGRGFAAIATEVGEADEEAVALGTS